MYKLLFHLSTQVPGSVFYIQSNGQLNYFVVLQAVHAISKRNASSRVCGVLLNTLNCLMDLHIIEKKVRFHGNMSSPAPPTVSWTAVSVKTSVICCINFAVDYCCRVYFKNSLATGLTSS